jgi:hypothetical protein
MLDKKLRNDYRLSLLGSVVSSLSLKHRDGKTIFLGSNFVEISVSDIIDINNIYHVAVKNLKEGILYGERVI